MVGKNKKEMFDSVLFLLLFLILFVSFSIFAAGDMTITFNKPSNAVATSLSCTLVEGGETTCQLTCPLTNVQCCNEAGQYFSMLDTEGDETGIMDCRPLTICSADGDYRYLLVNAHYVDWDNDQADCVCLLGSINYWNIGFESSTSPSCCGDDANEFRRTRVGGTDAPEGFTSQPSDDACCNLNNKCIKLDGCYNSGSVRTEGALTAYCNEGAWQGGDAGTIQCDAIMGSAGYWNIGGEVSGTACCGDDANEYKKTRVCISGCTTQPSDDACCNLNNKCVYNSVCYSGGACNGNVVCNAGSWQMHCSNGVQDCGETGVDCGGADCAACLAFSSLYWTDMAGNQITQADYNDHVMLVAESVSSEGQQVNFAVWEEPGRCYDNDPAGNDISQSGSASMMWQTQSCGGNQFMFRASLDSNPAISDDSGLISISPTEDNMPPVAIITAPISVDIFSPDDEISFISDSYDIDDPIIGYLWDFDDGSTGNQKTETHSYPIGGPKTISLTVQDKRGETNQTDVTILIDVAGQNDAPAAIISSPYYGEIFSGLLITFDASRSIDDETGFENLIFRWDFDDGSTYENTGTAGAYFSKLFSVAGEHTARLIVVDEEGLTSQVETKFRIMGCKIPLNGDFEFVPILTCSSQSKHYFCQDESTWYDTFIENCQGADSIAGTIDDCCPRGYYCPSAGAACTERETRCDAYTTEAGCEAVGCFWLGSVCVDPTSLLSCSDYPAQESCNEDSLGLGVAGGIGIGTDICGKTFGNFIINASSCRCEWITAESVCKLAYDSNQIIGGDPFVTCLKSFSITDCIEGKQTLSWTATCQDGGTGECGTTDAQEQCSSGQKEVKCGTPVSQLGFFNIFNLIAAGMILSIYYIFASKETIKKKTARK